MAFNWTRPNRIPYPYIWLKFKAKDVETSDLVEYTVQDLPEDRYDEALNIMATQFLADAPMAKLKDASNDPDYVEDIVRIWKEIVRQRMVHVCFKNGSKEIIGLNFNYVSCQNDAPFLGQDVFKQKLISSIGENVLHDFFFF